MMLERAHPQPGTAIRRRPDVSSKTATSAVKVETSLATEHCHNVAAMAVMDMAVEMILGEIPGDSQAAAEIIEGVRTGLDISPDRRKKCPFCGKYHIKA